VRRGGAFDRFDLEVRGGLLGAVRLIVAVEEHGAGQQLVRIRYWPSWSRSAPILIAMPVLLSAAAVGSAWLPALLFGSLATGLVVRALDDSAGATAEIRQAIERRMGRVATVLASPPGLS
jgi:hypothetical protein